MSSSLRGRAPSGAPTTPSTDALDACAEELCRTLDPDVRVVGVGESAHFVLEINQLRARIVRRLVALHGVTHLALEVGPDEAGALDVWLRDASGTPLPDVVGPLTLALYGTFLTTLRDVLPPEERPVVVGVDLPNSLTLEPTLEPLDGLVQRLDPEASDAVAEARRLGAAVQGASAAASATAWTRMVRADQDALTVVLSGLSGRLDAFAEAHAASVDGAAWREASMLVRTAVTTERMLRAMADLFAGGGRTAETSLREQHVAHRVLDVLRDSPDATVAYVAHDNHVQRTPVAFAGEVAAFPAGQYLAGALGNRYVCVALTHRGDSVPEMVVPADNAVGFTVDVVPLDPPGAGSVEAGADHEDAKAVALSPDETTWRTVRSQSAEAEIDATSFDAAAVLRTASLDPMVEHLRAT